MWIETISTKFTSRIWQRVCKFKFAEFIPALVNVAVNNLSSCTLALTINTVFAMLWSLWSTKVRNKIKYVTLQKPRKIIWLKTELKFSLWHIPFCQHTAYKITCFQIIITTLPGKEWSYCFDDKRLFSFDSSLWSFNIVYGMFLGSICWWKREIIYSFKRTIQSRAASALCFPGSHLGWRLVGASLLGKRMHATCSNVVGSLEL